jgi:violaxanthin de-epoxidase
LNLSSDEKPVSNVAFKWVNVYPYASVYSTKPTLDPSYVPELTQIAKKVGVKFSDFVVTDNSCKPEPPLTVTKIADLDTLGDDVLAVEQDLGRGVRNGSR